MVRAAPAVAVTGRKPTRWRSGPRPARSIAPGSRRSAAARRRVTASGERLRVTRAPVSVNAGRRAADRVRDDHAREGPAADDLQPRRLPGRVEVGVGRVVVLGEHALLEREPRGLVLHGVEGRVVHDEDPRAVERAGIIAARPEQPVQMPRRGRLGKFVEPRERSAGVEDLRAPRRGAAAAGPGDCSPVDDGAVEEPRRAPAGHGGQRLPRPRPGCRPTARAAPPPSTPRRRPARRSPAPPRPRSPGGSRRSRAVTSTCSTGIAAPLQRRGGVAEAAVEEHDRRGRVAVGVADVGDQADPPRAGPRAVLPAAHGDLGRRPGGVERRLRDGPPPAASSASVVASADSAA